ncbi:MAG: class I SAM-dependent methyltransferase [Candidatus Kapaibacterium sp.]
MEHIEFNINAYKKFAPEYLNRHPEIYNDIEQNRIAAKIYVAKESILTGNNQLRAMDYGCGAGNLTNHLCGLGFEVTSGDVSGEFLKIIKMNFSDNCKVHTFKLNGEDLRELPDDSFDLIATYSVLHHIPDYLRAVKDMARVVKPGGILYIDHEASPEKWENNHYYELFTNQTKEPFTPGLFLNLLKPSWYVRKYKKIKNPRWQAEGDIHVWPDDHIEWDKIEDLLKDNFDFILIEDYLHYSRNYPLDIYNEFKDKCSDMRVMISRKKN